MSPVLPVLRLLQERLRPCPLQRRARFRHPRSKSIVGTLRLQRQFRQCEKRAVGIFCMPLYVPLNLSHSSNNGRILGRPLIAWYCIKCQPTAFQKDDEHPLVQKD